MYLVSLPLLSLGYSLSLSLGPPGANFSVFFLPLGMANRDDQQNRFAPKRSFSGADHMTGRRRVLAIIRRSSEVTDVAGY